VRWSATAEAENALATAFEIDTPAAKRTFLARKSIVVGGSVGLGDRAEVSKDGGKPPHSRKTGTAILVMRW